MDAQMPTQEPRTHELYRYLIGRGMPEGMNGLMQSNWTMDYIDSLERTIIQQSAHRRASEKQVEKAEEAAVAMTKSGCADRCKAGYQILDAIRSV